MKFKIFTILIKLQRSHESSGSAAVETNPLYILHRPELKGSKTFMGDNIPVQGIKKDGLPLPLKNEFPLEKLQLKYGRPPSLVKNRVRYCAPRLAVIWEPMFKRHALPFTYKMNPEQFWRPPPVRYLMPYMEKLLGPILEGRNQVP